MWRRFALINRLPAANFHPPLNLVMTAHPASTRAAAIPAGLSSEQLLEMYGFLRLTRTLEERLAALYRQTKVIGGLFRSLGQEGESVASAYALRRGPQPDVLSPLIRNLGAMLVMGAKPIEILRQYMAKETGPTRGREMNVHFNDLTLGYLGQISHLGDMVPVMAGITLTFKMRGEPRVGLVYVGDGATSTGAFHEGLNFAAVQRCPLVMIGEYNGYAYSTPPARQFAVRDLAEKARGYGIPAVTVDGNDVLAVYEATKLAVDRARVGKGVQFIEVKTYRRTGHAEHDDQSYVPPGEMEHWAASNDPVDRFVRALRDNDWVPARALDEVDTRVRDEVDRATDACLDDPLPAGESALGTVFAQPPSAEPLWYRAVTGPSPSPGAPNG